MAVKKQGKNKWFNDALGKVFVEEEDLFFQDSTKDYLAMLVKLQDHTDKISVLKEATDLRLSKLEAAWEDATCQKE